MFVSSWRWACFFIYASGKKHFVLVGSWFASLASPSLLCFSFVTPHCGSVFPVLRATCHPDHPAESQDRGPLNSSICTSFRCQVEKRCVNASFNNATRTLFTWGLVDLRLFTNLLSAISACLLRRRRACKAAVCACRLQDLKWRDQTFKPTCFYNDYKLRSVSAHSPCGLFLWKDRLALRST